MRFVNNLRQRVGKQHGDMVNDSVLTVDERNKALIMWIKEEQILVEEQLNYTNLCASLRLFEDNGLMRLKLKDDLRIHDWSTRNNTRSYFVVRTAAILHA